MINKKLRLSLLYTDLNEIVNVVKVVVILTRVSHLFEC